MRILFLATALTIAFCSTASAQSKPGGGGGGGGSPNTSTVTVPTVYDATGKAVATYTYPSIAMFKYGGGVIAVPMNFLITNNSVSSNQFVYSANIVQYYPTADCTGIPIIFNNGTANPGVRPVGYTRSNNQITAYIAAPGLSSELAFQSRSNGPGHCAADAGTIFGWSVGTTVILPPEPLTVQ